MPSDMMKYLCFLRHSVGEVYYDVVAVVERSKVEIVGLWKKRAAMELLEPVAGEMTLRGGSQKRRKWSVRPSTRLCLAR